MPFHTTDAANLGVITNHAPLPAGFEQDYDSWLYAKHRYSSGPLGDQLIPLCDKYGLLPKTVSKPPAERVNWSTVKKGQRVIVTLDGDIEVMGAFVGLGSGVFVMLDNARIVDGKPWTDEFPAYRVKLAEIRETILTTEAPQMIAGQRVDNFQPFNPLEAVAEQDAPKPSINNAKLLDIPKGKAIKVERDGKVIQAVFDRVGPGDHQFVATPKGETEVDVFDERLFIEQVTRAPRKPAKGRKRAARTRAPKPEPAAA